jgi:hypothetical protein
MFSQNENMPDEQRRQNPLAEPSILPLQCLLQFIEAAPIGTADNRRSGKQTAFAREEVGGLSPASRCAAGAVRGAALVRQWEGAGVTLAPLPWRRLRRAA